MNSNVDFILRLRHNLIKNTQKSYCVPIFQILSRTVTF